MKRIACVEHTGLRGARTAIKVSHALPRFTRSLIAIAVTATLTGCMVGPDYRRPALDVPGAYRTEVTPAAAVSLGDLPWWEVFQDPVLQDLIKQALANNLDLKQAVARVEQARAQVQVVGSPLYPQIGYGGGITRQSTPKVSTNRIEDVTYTDYAGSVNLSWEIDLWGKVRRATEAARSELLATEEFQRGVTISLLAEVASTYFQLLDADRELEIARETVKLYTKTLELFRERYTGGASGLLPVNRAAAQLANAAANIPQFERQVATLENRLSVLLGRAPGPIPRGAKLDAHKIAPVIPAGLPSQLLERRPDVKASEEILIAENAKVGVAQANFYPSLNLTGLFGGQHSSVSSVLSGSTSLWSLGAGLVGPIFTGGALTGELQAQEARWKRAQLGYEQTYLNALAEVADALEGRQQLQKVREFREIAVRELASSVDISLDRYLLGLASYFEVLQVEEQLYSTQLELAQTQAAQLTNVVQLYRALGGGWQHTPAEAFTPELQTSAQPPAKQAPN